MLRIRQKCVNPIPRLKFSSRAPGFRLSCFSRTMAKPNYQFEKRRKELDKKAKKAEKLRLKAEAARNPAAETPADATSESAQS